MWFLMLTLSLQVFSSTSQQYRHSTSGEYGVEWLEFGSCPPEKRGTNEIAANVYISRKNRKPIVVGNISNVVPFDDTISVKVNFYVLGSNLAWIPNFYTMTFLRGCTDGFLKMFKEGWTNYMLSFNISPPCPVPKGVYHNRGYDPETFLKNSLLPKEFIYGRYRMQMEYLGKNNKLMGCAYLSIDVVPIWRKKKQLKERPT